jgi:hypothetical protein
MSTKHMKSGSNFRMEIFSPFGGASAGSESNLRELLENGKIRENVSTDH